ncbi:MAG TPA: hypothetical protein VHS96_00760 [Bacteroidia bacterium]|nr:hypothetical protein [Bacteroidia bacterium]
MRFRVGLGIVLGMLLLGCQGDPQATLTATDSLPDSSAAVPDFPEITTALPVEPLVALPFGYYLDSITEWDSLTEHSTNLYFPQSGHDTVLNAMIRKALAATAKEYEPEPSADIFQSSSYDQWVTSVTVNNDLLSIHYLAQSFYFGAAHFVHGNPCMNIDVATHKWIRLTDVLTFSGKQSKSAFCEWVNAANPDRASELEPKDLVKDLDFHFRKDGMVLCFEDFAKGPGMEEFVVAIDGIQPYLKPWAMEQLGWASK